jgi:hypothetical protein
MSAFEQVTADEFDDAVERNLSSQKFKEQYARFAPFEPSGDDHCFVHRGSLTVSGNFTAPGFFTLIIGDLTVDRLVDLDNPEGSTKAVCSSLSAMSAAGCFQVTTENVALLTAIWLRAS